MYMSQANGSNTNHRLIYDFFLMYTRGRNKIRFPISFKHPRDPVDKKKLTHSYEF